jgi:mannose-6-phosphate isomerase-like protein (cupin superfamily)
MELGQEGADARFDGRRKVTIEEGLSLLPSTHGERFVKVFEHGSLRVEVYAPRGDDPQQPHTRDEVYIVAQGGGEFVIGESRLTFGPHDLLFAPAGQEHRFENFSDDLVVWVLFYGPEGGESPGEKRGLFETIKEALS